MALVNLANAGPTAIRITDTPTAPGGDHAYTATIVGNRDPGAVAGMGITYDVDLTVYTQWAAKHPDQARALRIVSDAEIAEMAAVVSDPAQTHGYEIGLEYIAANPPPSAPPVVVDIPNVAQFDDVLRCTEGNWEGVPDSKTFAWRMDGAANGVTVAAYAVKPEDVGHSFDCVVVATNALGSTEVVSNAITAT